MAVRLSSPSPAAMATCAQLRGGDGEGRERAEEGPCPRVAGRCFARGPQQCSPLICLDTPPCCALVISALQNTRRLCCPRSEEERKLCDNGLLALPALLSSEGRPPGIRRVCLDSAGLPCEDRRRVEPRLLSCSWRCACVCRYLLLAVHRALLLLLAMFFGRQLINVRASLPPLLDTVCVLVRGTLSPLSGSTAARSKE